MSFGGFGQNNNPQSTGFGGFGSNNNTSSGFGQPATNTSSFGGGSTLFGGNPQGSTGFGSGGTGFGAAPSGASAFASQNRPAFGAPAATTSGGGLFGGGTATAGTSAGFGGFGGNTANNTSGGGLFGQPAAQKPAFGAGTTGGGLFGSSAGGGFGQPANQTVGAFGGPANIGQNVPECQGTGSTPFQAFSEKEGTGSMTNHFQSISTMEPYKKYSYEELRLADYNGGRRFGNGSGQAGAFGQSNFSGGFGQQNNAFGQPQNNTGGGLFGQPATTSAPAFGGTQTAQSGFGTSAGGLFGGQNKPATGGMFGTSSSGTSSGGLFGTTGGGFGTGTTNTSSPFGGAGGLFGQSNNNQAQQQSKPLFGSGATATTGGFGTGGTGFGTGNTNTSTGGSLFGGGQTNNPFGQPQQNQTSNAFPGFGQTNQTQNNAPPAFGGFGQTQQQDQKPGGLFGSQPSTNTGGGLFGTANTNQQQNAGGGLFGNPQNNANQASTSSLFGAKPAATTNLFGNPNTNTSNTSGGLFGGLNNNNNQNQQNPSGGLFGGNNSQQQKPSLFGGTQPNTNAAGGLFGGLGGNNNQQQGGNSLFGGNNQQQQSSGGLLGGSNNQQGSSLFNTQQQQQPNAFASPPALNSSLMDPGSAYGSPSIFSGLPPPPVHVGPLATPINVKQKMKKSTILPHYKMTPNAGSRMVTPQKRGGFGFSYSTYGTPASASSNASTPGGLSSSLLYGSLGRGLGKSLSTSNLRRNFDSDGESILTPGAFSAGSTRYGGAGSLKRLTIDRSLRTDLFGDKGTPAALPSPERNDISKGPGILKKKVSFDSSALGGNTDYQNSLLTNGNENSSDKENSAAPSAEEQGFLRTPSRGRGLGSKTNGAPQQPEMEQVPRGNELAIVHEDASPESSSAPTPRAPPKTQDDQQPGPYWMKPSEAQINRMTQDEKRKIQNFSVGRKGCGYVEFNAPVDLSRMPLNDIYDNIVLIELRSITVYPDQSKKPPQGQGLNVPSTLYLENSWPRSRDRKTPLHEKSGPRFQKHIDRLRKVGGTEFVRYEKDTGTWVFKVPHFTTYGFDYDDDASEGESLHTSVEDGGLGSSVHSEAPDTPTPKSRLVRNERTSTSTGSTQRSFASTNDSSNVSSSPDDTFQFRKKKVITPGAFDEEATFEEEEPAYDEDDQDMEEVNNNQQSFLEERSAASPSDSGEDEPSDIHVTSGALPDDQSLVIHDEDNATDMEMAGAFPLPEDDGVGRKLGYGTPGKAAAFPVGDDWAEALQRTISPRKQDRQALRQTQAHVLEDREMDLEETPTASQQEGTAKMATSIDLMNSLWGKEQARRSGRNAKQATNGKGFKWPYRKKSLADPGDTMDSIEQDFHESYRPAWGPGSILLYAIPGKVDFSQSKTTPSDSIMKHGKLAIVSEGRDIRSATFTAPRQLTPESIKKQRANTKFDLDQGVPMAKPEQTPFRDIAARVQPDSAYEKTVWELASILFDDQDSEAYGVPAALKATYDHRIRKDRLISFWERLCENSAKQAVSAAPNAEERAIAHLSAHKLVEACDALAQGKDFRLAILVAQIGGDQTMRDDMDSQIGAWKDLKVLSEMTEPIRTLYSLLAGNTCVCEGEKGPAEDRAKTFVISERFDMDWKRAFGLRLFYAILADEPIEAAVVKFANDLQADEGKKPTPWFIEENTDLPWQDPNPHQREDVLWGLLKLFAASKSALPTPSIAETFAPQNTTGNPVDTRLSFQLYHALTLRFPTAPASAPFQADALAWTFATQLDSAGEWLWAMFALLHLSARDQRHMAIQSLLAHHAADIATEPANEYFQTLTEELKVPACWIFEAKALYVRNVQRDHVKEVGFLVKAGDWEEAHEVLRQEVGPTAVIEEDWERLQGILDAFQPGKDSIQEWGLGGQVYEDYLSLLTKNVRGKEKKEVLGRLLGALPTMMQGGKVAFKERVAVQEISGAVGKEVLAIKEKGMEGARVLQLPLTADAYLKHTMELSLQYYKAVMAK